LYFSAPPGLKALFFLMTPNDFHHHPPSYFVPQAGHFDSSLSSLVGIYANEFHCGTFATFFQNKNDKCPGLGTHGTIDI